jgi:hypothetical protein
MCIVKTISTITLMKTRVSSRLVRVVSGMASIYTISHPIHDSYEISSRNELRRCFQAAGLRAAIGGKTGN